MDLPLDDHLRIGVQTIHRRTEPATVRGCRPSTRCATWSSLVDRCGYDSLWVGDHVSFTIAIFDPLLQLAQAAVVSRRLVLGTDVYLLPLRHPTPVAKQVSTLDHLTEGRFIFGVGVGGEFPKEYEACGVPLGERGARLSESLAVLRKLWTGEPVSHARPLLQVRGRDDAAAAAPARRPADLVRRPLRCRAAAHRTHDRRLDVLRRDARHVPPRAGKDRDGGRARAAASSTAASAPPTCCSRASTTPTKRRSMRRRSRSASATPWTSARPPSATARSARRSEVVETIRTFPRGRRAPPHPRLRRPLRGARHGRSSASPREALPLLAGNNRHSLKDMTMRLGMLLRYHGAQPDGLERRCSRPNAWATIRCGAARPTAPTR